MLKLIGIKRKHLQKKLSAAQIKGTSYLLKKPRKMLYLGRNWPRQCKNPHKVVVVVVVVFFLFRSVESVSKAVTDPRAEVGRSIVMLSQALEPAVWHP